MNPRPARRVVNGKYVDLLIRGKAKKTPQGWRLGGRTFEQGRGTVKVSKGGYFLDRHTGLVFSKRERNTSKRRCNPRRRASRNPSPKDIRKEFAGRVGPGADLYFPNNTPHGLAKLGKLVAIETEEGTIKPVHGSAWLCADKRGRLHIGSVSGANLYNGPRRDFGKVKRVEYDESKPHLGYHSPIIWTHKMAEGGGVRPRLYADGQGGLVFKGGSYQIRREGIVG